MRQSASSVTIDVVAELGGTDGKHKTQDATSWISCSNAKRGTTADVMPVANVRTECAIDAGAKVGRDRAAPRCETSSATQHAVKTAVELSPVPAAVDSHGTMLEPDAKRARRIRFAPASGSDRLELLRQCSKREPTMPERH